ncbi:MAG TPA: DUF1684 domain-containing protein [Polyangia bacterium]|jgi:hypothetical protein
MATPERPTLEQPSSDDLFAEVRAYREARLKRLTAPTGWLSLIGKLWLGEGSYRIGAAPDADVWLDVPGVPDLLGTVTRQGTEVRFTAAPGVEAFARGARIDSLALRSDAEPQPDEVSVGSLRVELIRRGDDFAVRVRDPDSPTRRAFTSVPAYDIDPRWRIVARFEPQVPQVAFELEDSDGRPRLHLSPGAALFEVDGVPARLQLLPEGDDRLFVLFGDVTNRTTTYGAGRFLYAPLPVDGQVVLDFNKAFNPPCSFTSFAACPLPPAGNRLGFPVPAGEKRPEH